MTWDRQDHLARRVHKDRRGLLDHQGKKVILALKALKESRDLKVRGT